MVTARCAWSGLVRRISFFLAVGLGIAGTALAPVSAQESPFTVTPRLGLSTTATDNVDAAPRGEEESEVIFRVTPGISATAEGNRLTGTADYSLINRFYARDSDRNSASHALRASGNAEILEDFLFLDASARRRETGFSLLDPVGIDEGVGRAGATTVTTWRVSPYVTRRLGRLANVTARYGHQRVYYSRGAARDSETDTYQVDVDSGTAFGRTFWSANYSRRELGYRDEADVPGLGNEVILEQISGTLGRQLTRQFRIFGTVGEERNRFETGLDDRDGSFWSAGFGWSPTRNTSVEATYGERFFGETRTVDIRHRRRNTLWQASYFQEIATNQREGAATPEEIIEIIGDAEDELTLEDFRVTREEVSVFERAQASVTLDLRRSRWTLLGFYSEREFLQASAGVRADQTRAGVQGRVAWDLGPRTTWTTSLRYAEALTEADSLEVLWSGRTGLTQQLGQTMRGSLFYRHQQRASRVGVTGFRENAVTASLNMTF